MPRKAARIIDLFSEGQSSKPHRDHQVLQNGAEELQKATAAHAATTVPLPVRQRGDPGQSHKHI